MKRYLYYLASVIVATSLLSCAVGPKYQKPIVENPEIFRYQNENQDTLVNLVWWTIFNDPVLESLIHEGLSNNKNVLVALSRIEQARANVGFNKADFGPKIGVEGVAGNTNFFQGLKQEEAVSLYSGNTNLYWELDFWGKIRRANEAARAELLSTFYAKRAIELSLISEIASNYFDILDYRARLNISEQTFASRDSALTIIELRYEKGIIPLIDVNQSQVQRSIAQAAIPQYKRLIAQSEHNLSVLLGKNPDVIDIQTNLLNQSIPDSIPVGIPSQLLRRRPDIAGYEELYKAQNARIGVAQAMRLPAISLTGLLGIGSTELSDVVSNGLGWGAGVSLMGPLFEWGKNVRRVDIEREKAKQSLYQYEFSVINAFREVQDGLISIQTYKEELKAREEGVVAAQSARELSEMRYDKGVTSYLEVLETQRQEFEAKLGYSQNYNLVLRSYINLYKVLGGGWITRNEKERYAIQKAEREGLESAVVESQEAVYTGQIPDLYLTKEEIQLRKEEKKLQRKLEREERKNK
ncbi:efflux transporter outer membrane subunit [Namhaeicola litoreus]|uniref:Efflux transporter outer membrane subunit n=1 Tax=Namhaeicola litoreus TaxID=1052145 RepID=A0ABW3Y4X0_9FLAO